MSITEREKLVLNAIVNYYLNFGDTIGSRTLVKKYGIDLSSATIRNVMADLEDMGFIAKTHTSSGRIPTDKGYKYYLDIDCSCYDFYKNDKLVYSVLHVDGARWRIYKANIYGYYNDNDLPVKSGELNWSRNLNFKLNRIDISAYGL